MKSEEIRTQRGEIDYFMETMPIQVFPILYGSNGESKRTVLS